MRISEKNKLILFIFISIVMLLIGIYTYKDNEKVVDAKNINNLSEEVKMISEEVESVKIEEYIDVWTLANVDIKLESNTNSETIGNYNWNVGIPVTYIDDNWAKIKGTEFYVDRNLISESPINFINYDVPSNNSIKSYMGYKCITIKSSDQYKLQQSSAYTDDYGLRLVNGRYCIAVGSYYTTKIGQYIDIELENGNIIPAILADCKADIHTDYSNRMNHNGSVIEFIVDTDLLDKTAKRMGDISYINEWNSKVINIKVYDKVENFK